MSEASPPEGRPQSGPSIFIAAHVAALVLLYGVALVAGGGFASPPFPPELPVLASATVSTVSIPADRNAVADAMPAVGLPANTDIAPPWTFDRDGRAQLSAR